MRYNNLGRSGLKVSEFSFGSWLTFGGALDQKGAEKCMRIAFDAGINFFDTAETYAQGQAERMMGRALKKFRREDVVVSTKLFWGGDGPNDTGLSRKHLMEGLAQSLRRLQLEYVDLLFCHRPDPSTPIEETVRTMDMIVRSGRAFYWGTSQWSVEQLEEAYRVAREYSCIPPTMEQPQYSILYRDKVEREFLPLYEKYGLGTTIWSPLASGILTGKYNAGVPKRSRLGKETWLRERATPEKIEKVKQLQPIAAELGCSMAQLALAWCLKNPHVNTVILGASSAAQLKENLAALPVVERLDTEVMARVAALL